MMIWGGEKVWWVCETYEGIEQRVLQHVAPWLFKVSGCHVHLRRVEPTRCRDASSLTFWQPITIMWAMLGALLLLIDGASLLATGTLPFALDAVRHSFAIGFITLLICGIAPRMLPSFSGGQIVSPRLVSATLWLGNAAAVLRVGSILFAPFLPGPQGYAFDTFLLSLSGLCGLALAICLAINLWPTLRFYPRHVV